MPETALRTALLEMRDQMRRWKHEGFELSAVHSDVQRWADGLDALLAAPEPPEVDAGGSLPKEEHE